MKVLKAILIIVGLVFVFYILNNISAGDSLKGESVDLRTKMVILSTNYVPEPSDIADNDWIYGEIKNKTGSDYKMVKIVNTIYDSERNVLSTTHSYVRNIRNGETKSFEMLAKKSSKRDSYKVIVDLLVE